MTGILMAALLEAAMNGKRWRLSLVLLMGTGESPSLSFLK